MPNSFPTRRSSDLSGVQATVNYATANGTASTADSDYTAITATPLTFAPGTTKQTVTVLVNGDTKFEEDETFSVNLSGPVNATLGTSRATHTITNDDAQPTVSITGPGSLAEGNSGTTK